jgi:hypothetical protein
VPIETGGVAEIVGVRGLTLAVKPAAPTPVKEA